MRAEALDATIYGMAVRGLVGVDLTARENALRGIGANVTQPQVSRSKWFYGERD